ncbi:MAG: EamA family transporter [Alphaproteobacteria bacterium]|nr:EamA family transporter [Alphaproteobacteria bacterium]
MSTMLMALFALSVTCDVLGQLCFKTGADRLPEIGGMAGLGLFLRHLVKAPVVLLGVAIYGVEFVVWLRILSLAPLSLAFPIASLNYCGVALASHLILHERLTPRRWGGVAIITAGVAIVGLSEAVQG